ncbi:MAG: hypothetical protein HDT14_11420 [Oscillibacter sp.]|nr:hypothetical protein [Oscillibacter sp.]
MVGAISGMSSYFSVHGGYGPLQQAAQAWNPQSGESARSVQRGPQTSIWAARRGASPETPVQPVTPVRAVDGEENQPARLGPAAREGADPAEMAVRMRIMPYEDPADSQKSQEGGQNDDGLKAGAESAQAALEEGECQTCEKRKYQDGSDDMGVSFQTPTRVAPEQAAAAVRGHENEHVVRERAKAQQEGRRVVSQSVTIHTDICPECGKVYVSGGTTRTVTAANPKQDDKQEQEQKGLDLYA